MGFPIILKKLYDYAELGMKKVLRCSVVLLAFAIALVAFTTTARADKIVYLIPIKGTINSRVARFVGRAIDEAEEAKANAIILEINTFGGRLDAATKTRDSVLDSKILTIAFVNELCKCTKTCSNMLHLEQRAGLGENWR